ncbi:MAG: DUF3365 domain-containing protein [Planctomycetota bacterium]
MSDAAASAAPAAPEAQPDGARLPAWLPPGPARHERLGWALCAVTLLLALLSGPLVRACGERWALALAAGGYLRSPAIPGTTPLGAWPAETVTPDPWGRPLIVRGFTALGIPARVYSRGPNGVDEDGLGDDREVPAADQRLGRVLALLPTTLVCAVLLLAWCLRGTCVHRPRRTDRAHDELLPALAAASLPLLLVPLTLLLATGGKGGIGEELLDPVVKRLGASGPALVTPELAFFLTWPPLALGLAWAWRLSRPLEAAPEPLMQHDSAAPAPPPLGAALLALACALTLTGCPRPSAPPTPPPPAAPSAPAAPPSGGAPARAPLAKAAAEALGKRLMARLQQALTSEGTAGGIRACSAEAQELTAAVAKEQGVAIGRTSFRLRNPKNAPPEWAREWVTAKVAEPRFQEQPDGRLRALLPIKLQPLCVVCHGPADQLGDDVKQVLAERYPQDQATGFQPGDLRGWFWVELPPPAR